MSAQTRVDRSVDDLHRLRASVATWFDRRTDADPQHQYENVLRRIRDEVNRSLDRLEQEYGRITWSDLGIVYTECRRLDAVCYFVWKLWDWYRAKFAQRDTDMRPVLLAADEVVHSCFATAFPKKAERPTSEPLVYTEPMPAPDARRWYVPPEGIDPPAESEPMARVLGNRIALLNIPTIRLPSSALHEPWMLVLLAHEVGHHLQQGLGEQVWNGFGTELGDLASRKVGPDAASRWRSWSREIFADVFGVLCCGRSLIWAISELEFRSAEQMANGTLGYPPPPIRWQFMAGILESAGLPPLPDTIGTSPSGAVALAEKPEPTWSSDLAAVIPMAKSVLTVSGDGIQMPDFLRLSHFAPVDHQPHGAIDTWAGRLRRSAQPIGSGYRADARWCAAAAVQEWARIAPSAGRAQREDFAGRILNQLILCHEEGSRAGRPGKPTGISTFADDLLALSLDDLGVSR